MTLALFIDAIGWAAMVLLVAAYGLVSTGRMTAQGVPYQLANLAGGIALTVNTWWHGAMPSVILNIFWAGIAVAALWRARRPAVG